MGRPHDTGKRSIEDPDPDPTADAASADPGPSSSSGAASSVLLAPSSAQGAPFRIPSDLSPVELAMLAEYIPVADARTAHMLLEADGRGGQAVLVSARTSCPHVTSRPQASAGSASTSHAPQSAPPPSPPQFPLITSFPLFDSLCSRCKDPSENWLCLHCGEVACGRYTGGHMLEHHQQTGHPVAFGFRDLSVWCFRCDEYLDALHIPELRPAFQELHRMKFGSNPPLPEVEQRQLAGPPA